MNERAKTGWHAAGTGLRSVDEVSDSLVEGGSVSVRCV
jgi:hypothetical protein